MASEKALRTRRHILDTARGMILKEGLDSVTMDRLAAHCDISKGACLYHFKTKRALFAALISDYATHLEDRLQECMARFKDQAQDPLILAYSAWFDEFNANDEGFAAIGVSLLSLQVHDPELLEPVRQWYRSVYKRIVDSPMDTRRALTAVMAFEGFFFAHKFGLDWVDPATKHEVQKFIIEEVSPSKPLKA